MKRLYWFCECGNVERTANGDELIDGTPGDLVVRQAPCYNCHRPMLLINGNFEKDKREWEAIKSGEMPN